MSSKYTKIPMTARIVVSHSGILPIGEFAGKKFTIRLYEGLASKGFRSGYERKPHRWVEVTAFDSHKAYYRRVNTYSGKRYDQAERDFEDAVISILNATQEAEAKGIAVGAGA